MKFEEETQKKLGLELKRTSNQKGSNNHYSRRVLDTITGVIYDTIKQAAEELDISYSLLRHKVSDNNFYLKRL